MSPVQNVWRQLVQRRLWPVAIVLVAGLAAVPLMLAKDPEPAPALPVTPVQTDENDINAEPIVAMASVDASSKRRHVLGTRKNPFVVAKKEKTTETTDKASDSVVTKTKSSNDPSGDSGSGSGGGTTTPSAPTAPAPTTPVVPQPEPKTYAPQELTVRFGNDDRKRRSLKRLQALPSETEPVLIYMGLLKDGKTAEFMVGDGVTPVGDGECRPSPEECQTVRLRAGETEFIDIKDETGAVTDQFQLDLIKIHKGGGGASASKASAKASVKAAVRLLDGGAALRATVGQSTARLP